MGCRVSGVVKKENIYVRTRYLVFLISPYTLHPTPYPQYPRQAFRSRYFYVDGINSSGQIPELDRNSRRTQGELKEAKSLLIQGNCVVEQPLTREQVAKNLQPQVTMRQLQKYLDLASLYLPEFADCRTLTHRATPANSFKVSSNPSHAQYSKTENPAVH
ncbi:hypothetical protein NIES2100_79370 [Calothrix sp. NIES-2100]|nr:hypothetical protein NIES2100_79370 [Calothrix sp. NIES-2100]